MEEICELLRQGEIDSAVLVCIKNNIIDENKNQAAQMVVA